MIEPYTLLAIGITLIALEAVIASFVVIWFGFGFVLVAFISFFYAYSNVIWQLSTISIFSMILIFTFRNKFIKKFLESKVKVSDDFLNEEGIGEIKNSKVFYKGTYWEIDQNININDFEENEKIIVLKTSRNVAFIKKKELL